MLDRKFGRIGERRTLNCCEKRVFRGVRPDPAQMFGTSNKSGTLLLLDRYYASVRLDFEMGHASEKLLK